MHFKWKRSFGGMLASSLVALVATTSLYAIPRAACEPKPDVCCEEPKPGPFAFAFPKDMNLACPRDFYIHIDALAFQAKEDGLTFGIEDASALNVPLSNGKALGFSSQNGDYGYNYGMRFGLGFYLNHDAWNLDFNWTWINITEYKRQMVQPSGSIVPSHLVGTTTPVGFYGLSASGKWNVHYDMLDIRLAKPYHVSRYVILKPHFGLRAGWIDQHYAVDYSGVGTATRTIFHADNDFWGVGSRLGFDSQWMLGKGFWLFGNFAASMLFGKFDISQRLAIPSTTADGYTVDDDHYQNCPNMEMMLGFGWGHFFSRSKYYVSLEAAYEFHEWWDQLNIRRFSSGQGSTGAFTNETVARGNLTLNGFSLKLALDF